MSAEKPDAQQLLELLSRVTLLDLLEAVAAKQADNMFRSAQSARAAKTEVDKDQRWLETKTAAKYLAMHPDTLSKLARERSIEFEQEAPGCKRYFRKSVLDTWRAGGGASAHRQRRVDGDRRAA